MSLIETEPSDICTRTRLTKSERSGITSITKALGHWPRGQFLSIQVSQGIEPFLLWLQ